MLHIVTGGVIAYEISGIIKQPPFVIDTFSGVQRQVICQLMVTKTPTAYTIIGSLVLNISYLFYDFLHNYG